MSRNTTFNLPEDLIARAKAYAATHGTTVTAIIREHLDRVTGSDAPLKNRADPLVAFSLGLISKKDAIEALGLRDYADLLVRLGDAGLKLPMLPPHEIDNQATVFEMLWKREGQ